MFSSFVHLYRNSKSSQNLLSSSRPIWKNRSFLQRCVSMNIDGRNDRKEDEYTSDITLKTMPGGGLEKLQSVREEVYFNQQQTDLMDKLIEKSRHSTNLFEDILVGSICVNENNRDEREGKGMSLDYDNDEHNNKMYNKIIDSSSSLVEDQEAITKTRSVSFIPNWDYIGATRTDKFSENLYIFEEEMGTLRTKSSSIQNTIRIYSKLSSSPSSSSSSTLKSQSSSGISSPRKDSHSSTSSHDEAN